MAKWEREEEHKAREDFLARGIRVASRQPQCWAQVDPPNPTNPEKIPKSEWWDDWAEPPEYPIVRFIGFIEDDDKDEDNRPLWRS